MTETLSTNDRQKALIALDQWLHDPVRDAITREFTFPGFTEAFAFMRKVAELAEASNHHPDWSNSYNRVTISLTTHSAGGLTARDIALAEAIDALAG